ncbi:MAG: protein-L-isoaspartate(D-aspartate) O-methyltransferase [Pseudomonadaceae bacterium]|nr:protein-L-isoaspartate(D-aspartate) O-methyltransferase [Pseudomonadaceae bacterium]
MVELLQLNPQFRGIGFTSQRTRNRMIERLVEQGITNNKVLETLRNLPRHLFVDEALSHRAYEDTALPIGLGQTLSQPYIVARMTELLLEKNPNKVLEIGTGSGYQCAVLGCLVQEVWSVERLEPLLEKARQRVKDLKLNNIKLRHADGNFGLATAAPFDAILVTAAPNEVPNSLFEQLAEGGRLIIPVGKEQQMLSVFDKEEGQMIQTNIEPVRFVPLLSGANK